MMSLAATNPRRSKRKQVSHNGSLAKNQKQSPEKGPQLTKITNLNDDCLEHIFGYLSVSDLSRAAEANSLLVPAARLVYKRMYGEQTVAISQSSHVICVYKGSHTTSDTVEATAESFLCNFGDLIKKLELDYKKNGYKNAHHWRAVEKVIVKYCRESLTEIKLTNCSGNIMEEIHVPFENVISVSVTDNFDCDTSIQLDRLFPNMCQLQLDGKVFNHTGLIEWKLRHLKKLYLSVLGLGPNAYANFQNLLLVNSHIKKLTINFNYNGAFVGTSKMLLFLSQTMTQLEDLRLYNIQMCFIITKMSIHFKNIKTFKIKTIGDFPENLSLTFDDLKSLHLIQVNGADEKWLEFMAQNRSLEKLGFFPSMYSNEQTVGGLMQITTKMPQLKEIQLQARFIAPNVLKQFVHQCENVGHPAVVRLKFFDGFKSDRDKYWVIADERRWKKECLLKVTGDEIVLHNRRVEMN